MNQENNLLTEVFPSWFFFSTCQYTRGIRYDAKMVELQPNLCNSEFEVLLSDVLPTFTERIHSYSDSDQRHQRICGPIHTRFCADTTDFSTGALTHLLGESAEVDASLERHLWS